MLLELTVLALDAPTDDHITEDQHQQQAKVSTPQHATEHRGAQRLEYLRPRTFGCQARFHSQKTGEGGHEHQSQAYATRLDRGREAVLASLLRGACPCDNEDGLLAGQAS